MRPLVPQQMFLPCERLPAVEAVVGPVRLNPHVQLDVSVEVLAAAVRLRAALIGAVEQPGPVRAVGLRHVLLLLLLLLLGVVLGWAGRRVVDGRAGTSRVRTAGLNKVQVYNNPDI